MPMSETIKKIGLAAILFMITCTFACSQEGNAESHIRQILDRQSAAWSEGDIDGFMENYWHSDSLKFVGKDGITYGWQATLDRYKKSYPDRTAMGTLTFDIVDAEQTGEEIFFVLGKWHLDRDGLENLQGHFTLLWKKIDGQWVIVTDHSS